MNVLAKSSSRASKNRLKSITFSGFGGGLNTLESDLAMSAKYMPVLTNFKRTPNGSQKLRHGSAWFADYGHVVTGEGVDGVYFSDNILSVTHTGQIVAVDVDGVPTKIWDNVIAALLPGAPLGWGLGGVTPLDSIDFVRFKTRLILHNGIDKPLSIAANLAITYLQDEATGSNTNTPVGKYGCVVSNYHCIAGIPAEPTTVYISSKGTAGTFPGDPAPNDSISIDVGAYAPDGASEIRGIAGFRSNLIVFFRGASLIVKLGVYDGATHTPEFPDSLPQVGILGHRCKKQNADGDLVFGGLEGVSSAKRNLFSGLVDSSQLTDYVEPSYRSLVGSLTDDEMLKSCFLVHDKMDKDMIIFFPEGRAFIYSASEKLRYRGWSEASFPEYRWGCESSLGRVFFGLGTRIFQQGNSVYDGERRHADRENDRDASWATVTQYNVGDIIHDDDIDKSYECLIQHISGVDTFAIDRAAFPDRWEEYLGEPIAFDLELPWLDGKNKMTIKHAKFISISTKGKAKFTVKAWVDNLYRDDDGVIVYDPALSMEFIANDSVPFGQDAGPYGGGRRSRDPRLFKFPVKFKTLKIAVTGSTRERLELSDMSFLYLEGKFKR